MNAARSMALARADLANVRRDPLLLGAALAPIPLTLLLRFAWSELSLRLAPWVDLAPQAGLVAVVAGLLGPVLLGSVCGFMLLEERDEGVAEVFAISPLRPRGWLAWRLAAPALVALLGFIGITEMSGLPAPRGGAMLGALAMAALEAPLFAALLAGLAHDKVEGLALSKALNLLIVLPLAFVLWGSPLRWALLALPTTWTVAVGTGALPAWAGWLGLAVHGLWLWAAARRL